MSLSLAENVIIESPHMLDKIMYSSWVSRVLLYIRGKENGKLLVDSVLNSPFKYGTITVLGTPTTRARVRDRTYDELADAEKIHEGNKEAQVAYLKHTEERANTLREIVEHARDSSPLDSDLDSACTFITRVQELLVYVKDTCPSSVRQSEKLIAVTPINKFKKVRFAEPSTSSSNIHKNVESSKTKDANKPLLPSTRVISSTSSSKSKPLDNTKKNRISRPTNSNKKNKVEDHLRSLNPSLNKMNHVSKPVCNANVKHSILNANSKLICATCSECMFDAIHDLCVLDYVNDMNVRVKLKSIKSKKKKVWKGRSNHDSLLYLKSFSDSKTSQQTPYELIHDTLTYFHVFGALCYPTIDGEDTGKLKPKADIGIFIGYVPAKKADVFQKF
nr:integrase, catalytic region, zinc finger, CCHC-type, peptidase aspartic, catalytic [Tanacetum cinerariifolium]